MQRIKTGLEINAHRVALQVGARGKEGSDGRFCRAGTSEMREGQMEGSYDQGSEEGELRLVVLNFSVKHGEHVGNTRYQKR